MINKKSNGIEKVDFDKYVDEYETILEQDLKFFGEESGYFAEYKVKIVKETLSAEPQNILEYGCGIGLNLRHFKRHFPTSEISGCDISRESIKFASRKNTDVSLFIGDDESLSERKGKFDLVFVSCVFHHIAPELRSKSIKHINDLLKPGGTLYIFEHNPFNPVTRKIVKDCPWDKDAVLLSMNETERLMSGAGFEILGKKFTLFFPAQLGFLRTVEKFLGQIPLGGQYFVRGIKNNSI